mmetsp:Transcript_14750/g.22931  ORF Transcript_14750/g.22931 Transcript_14750/m.22931 type:complete len:564 (-) Transcript_14750:617-2308(-)
MAHRVWLISRIFENANRCHEGFVENCRLLDARLSENNILDVLSCHIAIKQTKPLPFQISCAKRPTLNQELKKAALALNASTASVGPALVIFHQTQNTQPLGEQWHEDLIARFSSPGGCFPECYSDVQYIGYRQSGVTDFTALQAAVRKRLDQESVRLHRPVRIIHRQLEALNKKFAGELSPSPVWGVLPDNFFRCPRRCFSCGVQCVETVGHEVDKIPHKAAEPLCVYNDRYKNIEQVCQQCLRNGKRNVVVETEVRTFGVYTGSKFQCQDCGIVHTSTAYFTGNDRDKIEKLRPDYCHVWTDTPRSDESIANNTSRMFIEQMQTVAASFASVGEAPVKAGLDAVKGWTMPAYWKADELITHCHACSTNLSNEKHHCRRCGEGFCEDCSSQKTPVPDRGWDKPVRVCDACYDILCGAETTGLQPGGSAMDAVDGHTEDDAEWEELESDPSIPEEKLNPPPIWAAAVRVPQEALETFSQPNLGRKGVETLVGTAHKVSKSIAGAGRAVTDFAAPSYWEKEGVEGAVCVVCSSSLQPDEEAEGGRTPSGRGSDVGFGLGTGTGER